MSPASRNDSRLEYAIYKFIVGLLVLGAAVASAIVVLIGFRLFAPSDIFGDWSMGYLAVAFLDDYTESSRLLVTGFAVVVGLVSLAMLARMWMQPGEPRQAMMHMLDDSAIGRVWVDSESVAIVVRQAVLSLPGVLDAEVRVRGKPLSPIELRVDVDYYPGVKLKDSGVQVRAAVHEAAKNLVGLEVRQIDVRENVVEPEKLGRMLA